MATPSNFSGAQMALVDRVADAGRMAIEVCEEHVPVLEAIRDGGTVSGARLVAYIGHLRSVSAALLELSIRMQDAQAAMETLAAQSAASSRQWIAATQIYEEARSAYRLIASRLNAAAHVVSNSVATDFVAIPNSYQRQ